jgi:hypothetical protein
MNQLWKKTFPFFDSETNAEMRFVMSGIARTSPDPFERYADQLWQINSQPLTGNGFPHHRRRS